MSRCVKCLLGKLSALEVSVKLTQRLDDYRRNGVEDSLHRGPGEGETRPRGRGSRVRHVCSHLEAMFYSEAREAIEGSLGRVILVAVA